jgi:hypothetical protein
MPIYKYDSPVFFDGFTVTQDVDVSDVMADARQALWTFYDPDFIEIPGAVTVLDAGTVRISATPALAAGSYQLVGIA